MKSVYTDFISVHTRFSKSVFTEVSADSKDFSKDSFTAHLYIREIAKGFKLSAFRNLKTEICRLQCTYGLAYQDFKLKVTFCILLAIIESSLLMTIVLIV